MKEILLVALLGAGIPTAASAECSRPWYIAGEFAVEQSNGIKVDLNLKQQGTRLTGTARFYSTALQTDVGGPVEGFINGDSFRFRVNWFQLRQDCQYIAGLMVSCNERSYDETGVYEGSINANGEIEGSTYPFERPNARTNFFATGLARCPGGFSGVGKAMDSVIGNAGNASNAEQTGPIILMPPRPMKPDIRVLDTGPISGNVRSKPDVRVLETAPIGNVQQGPSTAGASGCPAGSTPRRAQMGDDLCVPEAEAFQVFKENQEAARHWVNGAYGPQTCVAGLVWREAVSGDAVCVSPERRQAVRAMNGR